MNKKLDVQIFIEQHQDWEKLLAAKPYCLLISRDEVFGRKLLMLKYNQIESNFNEKIVRECRGLILDESTFEVVSFPFMKFGNVTEGGWVDVIDWSTAKTTEKIDGSLLKIVRIGDDLLISTNGTILASKAPIAEQIGCKYKSFGDIAEEVLHDKGMSYQDFDENFTYMFELVSPWTKVVVPHHANDMYFLGCRNNFTFQETFFADHPLAKKFKTPKIYPLNTLEACIETTKNMPWDQEGYVVVDANFHRNKIKSIAYCSAHHLKNNGVLSYSRAIELVRLNEIDEVVSYFPEFKDALMECKSRFWSLIENTEHEWAEYLKIDASLPTRKDKALWITKHFKMPGIAFGLLDKKIKSIRDFFMEVPTVKILKYLGYKDE